MTRRTTVLVSHEELAQLFTTLDLWNKIRNGKLNSDVHVRKSAPSKAYANATSEMLRHYNAAGAHACTTHQIIDHTGTILHWDEADIKAGIVTIAKATSGSQPTSST